MFIRQERPLIDEEYEIYDDNEIFLRKALTFTKGQYVAGSIQGMISSNVITKMSRV